MLKDTKIGGLISRLEQLNEVNLWLSSAGDESVIETIAELQREQLERGERPDGSTFNDYSSASVNMFGKSPGPIIWKNTGLFYSGIRAIINQEGVTIANDGTIDEVTGAKINLEVKFDEIIIGLQNDSIKELVAILQQKYLQNIREILFSGG